MSGFDIVVLLAVGLGALFGFRRGFVHETLTMVSWVAVIFAIRLFHAPLSAILRPIVHTASGAEVLAFALLFLVPYFGIRTLAKWAGGVSRSSVLGPFDRVLGLGFGALKAMIIVVLMFSVAMLGYDTVWGSSGRPNSITHARTYPLVNAGSAELVTILAARRHAAAAAELRARQAEGADDTDSEGT
jgi:membrane protein required for colicin V production